MYYNVNEYVDVDESMSTSSLDPELSNTINKLYEELNTLKFMLESPDTFISNFFSDLKAEVDLAFTKQIIMDSNNKNMYKLNETYTKMIERIDLFEKECLSNQVLCIRFILVFRLSEICQEKNSGIFF